MCKQTENQQELELDAPARVSTPARPPEADSVSRTPESNRAHRPARTEVEREAFGLKVLYDCEDAEVEYVSLPVTED